MKNSFTIGHLIFLTIFGWVTWSQAQEQRLINLGTLPGKMRFDPEWLLVQPGENVSVRLENTCQMQHNFVLCRQGKGNALKVAQEAWTLGAAAVEKAWVPDSDLVLAASPLVNPGDSASFSFTTPTEHGDYPFVCTLPGHAITMKGILRVGDPGDLPPNRKPSDRIPESGLERAKQKMKRYRPFMDGGPTVGGVIMPGQARFQADEKGLPKPVNKGVAVRLEQGASVLFDTELMNYAAGWKDGFVHFLDGREDERSEYRYELQGTLHFVSALKVEWLGKDGSNKDPRTNRLGPLDESWLDYEGLYHHQNQIIFRYRVHGTPVLDSPAFENDRGFIRTLRIGASDQALSITAFGKERYDFPPRQSPIQVQLRFREGVVELVQNDTGPNLTTLTDGGKPKWPESIKTIGQRANPTSSSAYVVDTLTLPFNNPWNALLYTSGHDFFSNGNAALCTSHGDVWTVSGIDQNLESLTWRRIATGLANPLGLRIVDDQIYVVDLHQISRLHDLNGDGEIDFYECFNNDCEVSSTHHRFTNDLQTDSKGNFFYLKCTDEGRSSHAGSVIRVSPDGKSFALHATGLRNPNGMGMGPNDEITFGKQQGGWIPSSGLHLVKEGGFYGYIPSHHHREAPTTFEQPFCWIPHGIDNSCGGQVWVPNDQRWGPFGGRLLHFSYGTCSMFLVYRQLIGDQWQGGVAQFPGIKFESGSMRARFRPQDGQLYVTGLRGWQTTAAMAGCFQRVRFNEGAPVIPTNVSVISKQEGIRLSFLQELKSEHAQDLSRYQVQQWNYKWSKNYGSPDFRPSNPNEKGRDPVEVLEVNLSENKKELTLRLKDLGPVMQMMVRYDLVFSNGVPMTGEVFLTLHNVPEKN